MHLVHLGSVKYKVYFPDLEQPFYRIEITTNSKQPFEKQLKRAEQPSRPDEEGRSPPRRSKGDSDTSVSCDRGVARGGEGAILLGVFNEFAFTSDVEEEKVRGRVDAGCRVSERAKGESLPCGKRAPRGLVSVIR